MSSRSLFDQAMFDMLGQCIGGHQGEIEELRLIFDEELRLIFDIFDLHSGNSSSIVGFAPSLRRLKVIRL